MARSIRLLIIVGTLSVWMLGPAPFASAQRACRETKVTAFDGGVFQSFGYSVAVSGDTAMIGADWDNDLGTQSGSAYVYQREPGPEGSWVFAQKLLASDGGGDDLFGFVTAIDGEVAVVGAPGHVDAGAPGTACAACVSRRPFRRCPRAPR